MKSERLAFKVSLGSPTSVEFTVDGKRYVGTIVLAIHGVIDKGTTSNDTPDGRFDYRVSVAVDTMEQGNG